MFPASPVASYGLLFLPQVAMPVAIATKVICLSAPSGEVLVQLHDLSTPDPSFLLGKEGGGGRGVPSREQS